MVKIEFLFTNIMWEMETEFLSKWIDACCQIKNNETNSRSSSSSRGTKISTTTIQLTEVPWNLPIHLVFLLTHTIHRTSPVVYFHSIFFFGFCFCSNKFSAIEPFLSFPLSHPSHSVLLYFYLKANFYFKSHKRHSSAAAQVIYAQNFFSSVFFPLNFLLFFRLFYNYIHNLFVMWSYLSLDMFRGMCTRFALFSNFPVSLALSLWASIWIGNSSWPEIWTLVKEEKRRKKKTT